MFKRIIVILLSILMICLYVIPAFATEIPQDNTTETNIEDTKDTEPAETAEEIKEDEVPLSEDSKKKEGTDNAGDDKKESSDDKEISQPLRTFNYEDDIVTIEALETEPDILPKDADFKCKEIKKKSDKYKDLIQTISEFYEVSEDQLEVIPYDITFISEGKETEPKDGSIKLKFELKEPIKVAEDEEFSVIHIGEEPEVILDDAVERDKVKEFEVELDSLSPVVLTKINNNNATISLKSTAMNGGEYYISKTPNVNDDGTKGTNYSHNMNYIDVVEVPGAISLEVTIEYGGESTSWDWACMWEGNHPEYTAGNNYSSSITGKLGGTHGTTSPYVIEGDTVTFGFRSDGSGVGDGYGYYAVIVPTIATDPIPDFHFEEKEDGTYALVFDKGGEINAFIKRPELQEQLSEYKNKISEIKLHKDTTKISNGAFADLPALTTVTMPRNPSLENIGRNAFKNCENLKEFTVPSTVTDIDSTAFNGNKSLEKVTFAQNSQLTTLPDGIFKDLEELSDVTLPENLTAIPNDCFNGCKKLKTLDVPASVTSIGDRAFQGSGIEEADFLDQITTIGEAAFKNCTGLTEVSISSTTTSIGASAFSGCSKVTDFTFENGTNFPTLPANIFENMTSLRRVKLPSNLTAMPDYCFSGCTSLQQVDIPNTVTKIGNSAFYGCSKLQDFEIPSQVTTIGTNVFRNCTSLRDMTISNTVTSVGSGLFYGCTGLIKAEFEDGCPLTTLPSEMFYGCNKLETVKLPDGVTAIPSSYFRDCTSLKHVDLPANLTSIGDYAFYNCYKLEEVPLTNKITSIGQYAFYNCDELTEVVIPKSVTSVGRYAWQNCDSLTSAVWEEGSTITNLSSGSYKGTGLFSGCKALTEIVLPSNLTSIPSELAYNCSNLPAIEIPPRVTTINSSAFYGCSKLTEVDIPDTCTRIESSAFNTSGLTHVELPANLTYIGDSAFNTTKLSEVTIPNKVTSVNNYAFANCSNLETVTFVDGGSNCTLGQYAFYQNYALKNIHLKDEITSIGYGTFQNDKRIKEVVIPANTTSVGSNAFYGTRNAKKLEFKASSKTLSIDVSNSGQTFAEMTSLEEIIIDRDVTSSYTKTNNFNNINPTASITIGSHVNTLDNMFVSLFSKDRDITFEGENDFTVSTRIENKSTDTKWSNFKGDFYVDPNGVVYKLDKSNNTASVFHIPKGLETYTIPETITSVAGQEYTVNKIESYALRDSELTALTVEKPENITVPQFAFSECPTLMTINNQSELFTDDWKDLSLLCGFPVHVDDEVAQVPMIRSTTTFESTDPEAAPQTFSFGVSISGQESMDGLTYVYPTGQSARLDFAISNESNVDMSDRVIRIYFAFDGENYTMGNYNPEQDYTLVNTATNSRYPFKVRKTDAQGVYYYDITGFKPGDTLAFNNNFSYLSPSSGGGTMMVWAESISAEEAAALDHKVSQPKNYILAEWYTEPVPYNVTKSVLNNTSFEFVSGTKDDDENIYVKNVQYQINVTSSGASGTSYAKDYVQYIDFEDDIQLNENMIWNPEAVAAVAAGDYYINNSNVAFVKIDNKWVELCSLSFGSTSLVRNVHLEPTTDKNGNPAIKICWSYRNTYWTNANSSPTADMPATSYSVYFREQALQVKPGSDLWGMLREGEEYTEEESRAMRQIDNKVEETTHYSYSDPQTKEAEAGSRLINLTTGFRMNKTLDGYNTFGRKHNFVISLTNSGLIHKTDVDMVTDSMPREFYIPAENIEAMFNDEKWGPYLNIDISSVTLCEKPEKQGTDVYGNAIEGFTAQQMGVEEIPYNGGASTDNSVITKKAKLSFHWNEDRSLIIMDVKNDAGEIQESKTIGANGDYASVKAALDDIGFIVVYQEVYDVKWDLGDNYTLYKARLDGNEVASIEALTPEQVSQYEYKLKSGKTETFRILSKVKDTTMMLESDNTYRYPSSYIYTNNTAYAKNDTGTNVGSSNYSEYVYREMELTKTAIVDGTSYTSGFKIPDNTVVDYRLSFSNSGDTFDILPLTDRMTGAQVLLVPVRGNKTAKYYAAGATEGVNLQDADLEVYNADGINYYVLNKSGSYKDVVIDGRIADTIKVTMSNGNADTLMTWYYRNVNGATVNSSSTSNSITYKALADSSRLGAPSAGNDGTTVTNHSIGNQAWLGGHQTHRLYTTLPGEIEQLQFSKWIVENPDAQRESLIRHSLVQSDDEVLYKMVIKNTGENEAVMTGNHLYDELPTTKAQFAWSKDNVKDIYYVTQDLGSSVNHQDRDHWYIDSIHPTTGANNASTGQYYIHWNNDFEIHFDPKSEIWIYVKLKFPGAEDGTSDEWDNYIAQNNGAVVTNTFIVDNRRSSVTHELVDVTEGILQKGVLDTGLSSSGVFQSENTRDYYQNGANTVGNSIQEVAYYTVIYNSGNVRLYLDPLQDELPAGFRFRGVFNAIPKNAETQDTYNTDGYSSYIYTLGRYGGTSSVSRLEYATGNSSYIPVATVTDGDKTIVYKNASISASATMKGNKEQITFTFGRYSNSDSYLKYDSSLGKYYLDPGEAIRFGYNCYVEGYKRTENVANNEIAMPVYDKYGLGVNISENVQINPASYRDITNNDGGCEKTTTEMEKDSRNHEKPSWAKNTTEWFSSNVSLRRLEPVPGVQKSVAGETMIPTTVTIKPTEIYGSLYTDGSPGGTQYVGTIARTSIANWLIKAYNEGGIGSNSMEDFWIEDTIDAPYKFTGNYFYDYYNVNGNKISSSPVPIFSLGGRTENDTTVKISTGQGSNTLTLDGTITINGDPVPVDGGRAEVQLLRNNEGVETLRIRFKDPYHRLPPNTYMALYAHTQYVSTDAVLSKQFYNHVELLPSTEFDPALVSQGKVLYKNDEGEQVPYAIESGASVTMTAGYTSAARKQVTELAQTSNTGWSDRTKNSIMLPEKNSKFRYDLYVDLPKDDPTKKLVLIDSLPEPDDHSPFIERDYRDSEFTVHMLSENLGFKVWTEANLGSGTSTEISDYTFEISSKTTFEADDWTGKEEGWTVINLSDGVSEAEASAIESARSFRVTIHDEDLITNPSEAIMGKNTQVHIRFNAEIENPEEANPGAIAWNSFGYRYTVPIGATGMETSLNAEPLKVGVQVPAVPSIIKDLKTPNNHYHKAAEATEYKFLIYKGSALPALNDTAEMSLADIAEILTAENRDVLMATVNIAQDTATGNSGFLDDEKIWTFDGTDYVASDNVWIWDNNARYTIIELPWEENGYIFSNTQHSTTNNYTFSQNTENNVSLRVTNEWNEKGNLSLEKAVQGPSADTNRKFTFTIHLQDGRYPVYGTYDYIGTNIRDGSLTFNDNGDASIQLKAGQKIVLQNIPSGYTYSVTESEDALYTSEGDNTSGAIETGQTSEVSFMNTRKETTLSVSKQVQGAFADRNKLFDFEIYIIDEGRELTGEYQGRITHTVGAATDVTLNFTEGAAMVQLKHGDTLIVSGLPLGARYEVSEMAASREGYTYTSENDAGVLTETGASVSYVNTKEGTLPTGINQAKPVLLAGIAILSLLMIFLKKKRSV